ncbi:MAG: glutathione S-transferase family protein [Gaiellales bacterium]
MSAVRCPYCVRTRLVLAEKGIEHDVEEIDLSNRPDILRRRNPRNKVPVLIHDAFVLSESAVINEYLDEVFRDEPMMPEDAAGRALVRRLLVAFEDITDAYYDFRRGEDAWPALDAQLQRLDGWLDGREYLAGESYTLADPGCWPWFARMELQMDIDLAPYPNLSDWKRRLEERPAYAAELGLMPVA